MAPKSPKRKAASIPKRKTPVADLRAGQPGSFGKRLKAAREAAGLTQQGLGDAVEMDKRMIARYEADQAAPSVHAAARMARAVGVSLDALGGLSAPAQDPELARLLAQIKELPEPDRTAIKRVITGLARLNGK